MTKQATAHHHLGISRFVTILQGIRPFDKSMLSKDVVAGVTLAALAIPEVMGYTKIAGTPVITGLYTILLPAIVFAILGSSRHLVVGGDSATAAILYAGIAGLSISGLQPNTNEWLAYASLAALITGGLLILARVARLGFLADFISRTVLVGFLTGVGIQVALGQFAGMLGVPSPKVSLDRLGGTVIKFWDTLKEIPDTSGATLAVSVSVIVILVVFEKWIPMIPGGLVAVVGMIAISWGFDLQSHGVSTLGVVPSGLPSIGLPSGVGWDDVGPLLATSVSMFLVIIAQSAATSRAYAVKYKDHVRGEQRPRRPQHREHRGRAQQHVRRQRQPDEDEDGGGVEGHEPGRDARDGGDGRDRPPVPDKAAAVHAERRARRRRLRDRREADRHRPHEADLPPSP